MRRRLHKLGVYLALAGGSVVLPACEGSVWDIIYASLNLAGAIVDVAS